MYVNDEFHHKEWLDFEYEFFESEFCDVAINKKFKILLSEYMKIQIPVNIF